MKVKPEEVLEAINNFNGWPKGAAKALGIDVRTLMIHVERLKKMGKSIPTLRPSRVRYLPEEMLLVLNECNGNRQQAAEILQIDVRSLRRRLRALDRTGEVYVPPAVPNGTSRADVPPEFIRQVRQWVEPKGWK